MKKTRAADTVRLSVLLAGLSLLLAACGKDAHEAPPAAAPATATQIPEQDTAAPVDDEDKHRANAVVTGKTAAAVDLKYDVSGRPEPGQPIELELVFLPRAAAEVLEIEVTGIPGFTVVSGNSQRFEAVHAGDRHVLKTVTNADGPGLYYVGVTARMVSKLLTEVRTFSVPVAVGTVPAAAQKAAPAQDASGQAVESMPAIESQEPGGGVGQ